MKILIGADLVPTKSNEVYFMQGDVETLVGQKLFALLKDADYRIFNLEVPFADSATPISKSGPALITPTSTVQGFRALGVDLLTLGNNHIMDQGNNGFGSTIDILQKSGIAYVGVGNNLQEAVKPYIVEIDNKKVGIYACTEREFSIAGENSPGANPFDSLESLDHIEQLKAKCDFVIVLYHGGKEHYRYPSPYLQKVCRKMVEKGADLILCQHSHCIGCEEKYLNGTIVYGQGNFLFDYQNNEFWQTGLLVEIGDGFKINYIPICKDGKFVKLADEGDSQRILLEFKQRSNEILQDGVLEDAYAVFAKSMRDYYLLTFLGVNRRSLVYRVLNRLMRGNYQQWLIKRKFNKNRLVVMENFIECEAHRELLIKGLKGN